MPRVSVKTQLDETCATRNLGWALDEDHVGSQVVMSACAFSWPDKEIVAAVGPVQGGKPERDELLRELRERVVALPSA